MVGIRGWMYAFWRMNTLPLRLFESASNWLESCIAVLGEFQKPIVVR